MTVPTLNVELKPYPQVHRLSWKLKLRSSSNLSSSLSTETTYAILSVLAPPLPTELPTRLSQRCPKRRAPARLPAVSAQRTGQVAAEEELPVRSYVRAVHVNADGEIHLQLSLVPHALHVLPRDLRLPARPRAHHVASDLLLLCRRGADAERDGECRAGVGRPSQARAGMRSENVTVRKAAGVKRGSHCNTQRYERQQLPTRPPLLDRHVSPSRFVPSSLPGREGLYFGIIKYLAHFSTAKGSLEPEACVRRSGTLSEIANICFLH
nr:hypothetical protein CFP56_28726 [Quercus suber]